VVRTNSAQAWFLAARPKTLAGASVPVIIGTALALSASHYSINVVPAVLCFLFAFIMQIDANFVNDYFDCIHGNDDETRLGPRRACAQGWITLDVMRRGIALTTLLACAVGAPLVIYGGWGMVVIGVLCVLFCFLYTTKLASLGLGDVLVLVFFGLVPVILTYYLEMPADNRPITLDVVVASVACGFVIDTMLVVNNYRDIENDKHNGKHTIVVMMGARLALAFYLVLGVSAIVLGAVHAFYGNVWASVLPLLYLILHYKTYLRMKSIQKGKALNMVLGENSRNMFIYSLLLAAGLLL